MANSETASIQSNWIDKNYRIIDIRSDTQNYHLSLTLLNISFL